MDRFCPTGGNFSSGFRINSNIVKSYTHRVLNPLNIFQIPVATHLGIFVRRKSSILGLKRNLSLRPVLAGVEKWIKGEFSRGDHVEFMSTRPCVCRPHILIVETFGFNFFGSLRLAPTLLNLQMHRKLTHIFFARV